MQLNKKISFSVLLVILVFSSGCTTTLVQPYDKDLYNNTEAFYKKTSSVINRGMKVSPKTSTEVKAIPDKQKEVHPAHFKQFEADYKELVVDANSLILRSLANSGKLDDIGQNVQLKIELAITKVLPDTCDTLQSSFPGVSLTTRNYIDLKCLIGKWSITHQGLGEQGDSTYGKQILKSSNWEARMGTLFQGILAIQKAEAFKNDKKGKE